MYTTIQTEGPVCLQVADGHKAPLPRPVNRFLVVDDEEDIREIVRIMLEAAGCEVTVASNGQKALDLARGAAEEIDVLITDLRMPEMDGIELAHQMRALSPETRILFISAFASDDFVAERIKPEQNLLAKPFSRAALLEKVREVLEEPLG